MNRSSLKKTSSQSKENDNKNLLSITNRSLSFKQLKGLQRLAHSVRTKSEKSLVIGQCRKPTAHSSIFGFFADTRAKTKNQKSLNFSNARPTEIKKQSVLLTNQTKQIRQDEFLW
jgi:hypothetical protein